MTGRGDVPGVIEAARAAGVTPDALALAAVLGQPWADVVLSGASTRAMLGSNLAAADVVVDVDRLGALREAPSVYWEKRSALPWN